MQMIPSDEFKYIPNHIGHACDQYSIFFAPPPKNLGNILSAQSNYREGDDPKRNLTRVAIFFICMTAAICMGCFFIDNQIYFFEQCVNYYVWIIIWVIFGAFLGYLCGVYKRSCSYVGEKGVAEYILDDRGRVKKNVLIFSEDINLYKNISRVYKLYSALERIYRRTKYIYQWQDVDKKVLFVIKGEYFSLYEQLDEMGYYAQLALATKNAWDSYIYAKMLTRFSSDQSIIVNIRKGGRFCFRRGYLSISRRMSNSTWELKDIEKIIYAHGLLRIYRKRGAGYAHFFNPFDSRVRVIRYCDIPNAEQTIKLINLVFPNSLSAY